MRIIRPETLPRVPWRNGQGLTRELLAHADDAGPLWRVSLADISADCTFSIFAGFDRSTVLLSGRGIALRSPRHPSIVLDRLHARIDYPGDVASACHLIGPEPVRVLNIMTARGRASVSTEIGDVSLHRPGGLFLVWCLTGFIAASPDHGIGPDQGLYGSDLPPLHGDATLLVARFSADR